MKRYSTRKRNTQHNSYAVRETEISIKGVVYETLNQFSGITRNSTVYSGSCQYLTSCSLAIIRDYYVFPFVANRNPREVFKYLSYKNFCALHNFSISNSFECYSYKSILQKKKMFYIKIAYIEDNEHYFGRLL